MESVETRLGFRRLRWLGHMARMNDEQISKRLLLGNLCSSDERGPGRPRKSWQDCVREDLATLHMQHNWNKVAQDRERWRSKMSKLLVHTPSLRAGK